MKLDWASAVLIKESKTGIDLIGWSYTVKQNGFIAIIECQTNADYWIRVNGVTAYHKCYLTNAASGLFPVVVNDRLYIDRVDANSFMPNTAVGTRIFFVPYK